MSFAWHWKHQQRRLAAITHNGEPFQVVHTGIFGNPPRLPKTLEEWPELELTLTRQFLADILSRRNYPTPLLRQKLQERAVSEEAANAALESLSKYIDDDRWAEHFVCHEIAKNHGPLLIAQKLKAKGFDPTPELLSPAYEAQHEKIKKLIEGSLRARPREKQAAALQRRGYTSEAIISLLD